MSFWAVALFFVEQPDGGFVAKCETFPLWRFEAPADTPGMRRFAESSLRDYVADELGVARYNVPLANSQIAEAAA